MIELKQRRVSRCERMEEGTFGYCFGGKDAPKPPDYSGVAAASEQSAKYAREMGKEQLAWAKEQWGQQYELIQEVMDVQLPMMEMQLEMAGMGLEAYMDALDMQMSIAWENHQNAMRDRDRYERIFQPIEDDLVQEFLAYDTQARQSLEAGRAQADVARAQDAQRKQAMMALESYGIDPSQTRSAALDASLRTQEASAQAAAGNQARQNVENTGRALRAEAINIGKGYPSNVAQSYQTALAGAGAGQAAGAGTVSMLNQTMGGIGQNASAWQGAAGVLGNPLGWNQAQNQAIGQWGNTLNTGYQNQLAGYNSSWTGNDTLNLLGGLGGMALGGWMMRAEGGEVEGPGGPKDDAIPARLSDGEYVIPEEVVRRKGTEFFDKLIEKTKGDVAQQREKLAQDQQEAQIKQRALQMAPVESPHAMSAGGEIIPTGGGGYGGMGTLPQNGVYFADGGEVNTSYGYHGNAMSLGGGAPLFFEKGGDSHAATRGSIGNQGGFGYRSDIAQVGYNTDKAFSTRRAALANTLANINYSGPGINAAGQSGGRRGYDPYRGRERIDVSGRLDEIRSQREASRAAREAEKARQAELEHQRALELAKARTAQRSSEQQRYEDYQRDVAIIEAQVAANRANYDPDGGQWSNWNAGPTTVYGTKADPRMAWKYKPESQWSNYDAKQARESRARLCAGGHKQYC